MLWEWAVSIAVGLSWCYGLWKFAMWMDRGDQE